MTRVLVVGGGPAGIATALWCRTLGLEARVLESAERPGGQLQRIYSMVGNYPGLRGTGAELAAALEAQARAAELDLRCGVAAAGLDPERGEVALEGGGHERGDCLVLATGTRPRELGVPGEAGLLGRGVSGSATRDRARFAGRPVVVVGGGDAAFENALLLAEVGCPVTLVVRGVAPRARAEFRRRVEDSKRIELLPGTRVEAILGTDRVEAVRLAGPAGAFERPAAGVVVKIGVAPNTEWCRGAIALDQEGYPRLGPGLRASHPRVRVAGDLTHPALPSLAHAVGSGAQAAAEILKTMVA